MPRTVIIRSHIACGARLDVKSQAQALQQLVGGLDSLRGSSVKIGTIQRRLAWPLRKDDTHKSRSVTILVFVVQAPPPPSPPLSSWPSSHPHFRVQIVSVCQKIVHFSICANHPCAGAMLIFSVFSPILTDDPRRESEP